MIYNLFYKWTIKIGKNITMAHIAHIFSYAANTKKFFIILKQEW